jgi:hypothetical protein
LFEHPLNLEARSRRHGHEGVHQGDCLFWLHLSKQWTLQFLGGLLELLVLEDLLDLLLLDLLVQHELLPDLSHLLILHLPHHLVLLQMRHRQTIR